ncbi:hypothetical protein M5D96_010928 [Drosophila gunungcola]|uniref:Uncharacterized protein n=1 Tax=Drosophila gunungcola TaxID=103775 RepID=A0A9Q0BLU0_9MUSC|nr:hypothetical protein M5D96_010928 [Drosophila gunungcola]
MNTTPISLIAVVLLVGFSSSTLKVKAITAARKIDQSANK